MVLASSVLARGYYLFNSLVNLFEARIGHPLLVFMGNIEWLPKHPTRSVDLADPLITARCVVHAPIVTINPTFMILHLHPSSRLEIVERLGVKARPIGYTST